ncbi:replication protein H [Haloarcula rubripromontorii]|uniref:replication protein H n=1 Tax=Haloarcula rubripromontorii TaxID=1705562 RepID=UPI00345BA3D9
MSLTLTTQGHIAPDAEITIGPEHFTSARAINRELWRPDHHDLADALLRALRQLVGDQDRASRREILAQEFDVTAFSTQLDGRSYYGYARLAAYGLDHQQAWIRFLRTTRRLGTSTDLGPSSMDDLEDGPIPILEAADVEPRLDVRLEDFQELKTNQQAALLRYLLRLTPGVEVHIIGSQLALRKLLRTHEDLLPASVTERAESGLLQPADVTTRSEQRREAAREDLAEKGDDHADWRRLKVLYDQPQESASYDTLEADTIADFPSRDALKQWVSRMREDELVETYGSMHDRHVRLLPAGFALLDEHPSIAVDPSHGGTGRTDVGVQGADTGQRSQQSTVSDPPKTHNSPVYSQTAGDGPPDRPDSEAATATAGGSGASSRDRLSVDFLDGWEHDAAVSMAQAGDIALCDRPADTDGDSREARWSFLDDRDEAVVRVEASQWGALTMVRLCTALLSEPAFQQVLTTDRLAGGQDRDGLDGLPVTNPIVLRDGACLGWMKNTDADAKSFRRRLRRARDGLEQLAEEIAPLQSASQEQQSQLLREAHGLAAVAARLYDMLGVDLNRVLDVPQWAVRDDDRRGHLVKMLAKQTACSSRYGVYSANRVLYEPRSEKREQLLGAPDVDDADPVGDVCGSWTLVGTDVHSLRDGLEKMDRQLVLQRGEANFSPFALNIDVVDADRRSAYAQAVARQANLKHITDTRPTTSLLRAFSSDPFAAAKAVSRLGSEEEMPRDMELHDVRSGLAMLDVDELLPDLGSRTISKVIQVLLDVDEPLSTSEVAELADRTTQALSTETNEQAFADLEAAGLLEREDLGRGKATNWRLRLPFDDERADTDAPTPTLHPDSTDLTALSERPMHRIADALFEATHRDIDYGSDRFLQATRSGGDLRPLLLERPDLIPLLQLLVELLDLAAGELPVDGAVRDGGPGLADGRGRITMGADPNPAVTQTSLAAAGD